MESTSKNGSFPSEISESLRAAIQRLIDEKVEEKM